MLLASAFFTEDKYSSPGHLLVNLPLGRVWAHPCMPISIPIRCLPARSPPHFCSYPVPRIHWIIGYSIYLIKVLLQLGSQLIDGVAA
jgi:hypothetical protein